MDLAPFHHMFAIVKITVHVYNFINKYLDIYGIRYTIITEWRSK